jgi:CheY-like chemotaxis protein
MAGDREFHPTVFVVEDEDYLREIYVNLLPTAGFRVVGVAGNGYEAVREILKLDPRPDVVLMDHRLPGKSGLEAAADVRRANPAQHFVFVTGDVTIKSEATAGGFSSFLAKPFTLRDLVRAINGLLRR